MLKTRKSINEITKIIEVILTQGLKSFLVQSIFNPVFMVCRSDVQTLLLHSYNTLSYWTTIAVWLALIQIDKAQDNGLTCYSHQEILLFNPG